MKLPRLPRSNAAIIAGLVFIAFIIVVFRLLHSPVMADYIRERMMAEARAQGIPVRIERAECGFTGCRVQNVYVLIPKAFASFLIEELVISPDYLKVLSSTLAVRVSGRMYGGSLNGSVNLDPHDGSLHASVVAEGMDAGKVPQLSGIGVSSGTANLSLNGLMVKGNVMRFEPSTFEILGAAKPQKTTLPPLVTGLPMSIEIPAMASLELKVAAEMKDEGLQIRQAALTSALGQASVNGAVSFTTQTPAFSLTGKAELNPAGQREIASMFGANATEIAASLPKKFQFRLGGNAASPDFTFQPVP